MSGKKDGEIIFQEEYAKKVWENMRSLADKTIEIEAKLDRSMEDYTTNAMKGECSNELALQWKQLAMNFNTTMTDMSFLQQEVIKAAKLITNVDLLASSQIKGE